MLVAGQPKLGVSSPERPTGLVEGNRFDTSIAVEILACRFFYHLPYYRQQDLFAGCGWTPSRSTLLNLVDGRRVRVATVGSVLPQLAG